MRNKVLETISESFKIDEKLYLLLGDLGVFQSRKAFEIDDYRSKETNIIMYRKRVKNIYAVVCGMADKYYGKGVHTDKII